MSEEEIRLIKGYFNNGYCCDLDELKEIANKMIDQLQQKENTIKEVREYIEEHKQKGYRIPMSDDYDFWNELNENEIKELLKILDKEVN